jgi:DNA-binding protein H-NS
MADSNILKRSRSLRKASNELSINELEKVVSQLLKLISERKAEEKQLMALQSEKQKRIRQFKSDMEAAGIDISDLNGTNSKPSAITSKKQPFKYEIDDGKGGKKKWSGAGRKPDLIIKYLKKKGSKLEDLLIK